MAIASKSDLRTEFFTALFQDNEGYVCIATSDPTAPKSQFHQEFFKWPGDSIKLENFVLSAERKYNVYFCVNLLERPERKKYQCLPSDVLWADLDAVDPTTLQIPPQILIQSSPGRWQALWLLSTAMPPAQAEELSKRIAYAMGADKSGWDLTQLLRVPFTRNRKYPTIPEITLTMIGTQTKCPPLLFEGLPQVVEDQVTDLPIEIPPEVPDYEQVIYKFSEKLNSAFKALFTYEPDDTEDWSKHLWRLLHICFEAGMTMEETFVVARESKVNKYRRDGRPDTHLWRDVLKAKASQDSLTVVKSAQFRPVYMPQILDEDSPIHEDTFIDRYRAWGIEATDAVPEFHDLSAMVLLSTIIANSVRLQTSYGPMIPNIWGMILGDSTLSRKTTAMRMVTDIIASLDSELVLATDGTAEGLLTGLETRPYKTSIFYKDELSGFFESINRREYLAGMPETLTALYDVPPIYTRRLRKETIKIESPIFIFYGGGVREKVYEAITEDYVYSGFLPRFLIVSGDTDLARLRRTGPPTEQGIKSRSAIVDEVADLYEYYASETIQHISGQKMTVPQRINAQLTQSAWERYGDIEQTLVESANSSSVPQLALPTFERLSRSTLKISVIIAASRQVPKNECVTVDKIDIDTAAWYTQKWGQHSVQLILNAGKKSSEKILDRVVRKVEDQPGIMRSALMQHFRWTKREADEFLSTLEDRGVLRKEKQGRGYSYFAA